MPRDLLAWVIRIYSLALGMQNIAAESYELGLHANCNGGGRDASMIFPSWAFGCTSRASSWFTNVLRSDGWHCIEILQDCLGPVRFIISNISLPIMQKLQHMVCMKALLNCGAWICFKYTCMTSSLDHRYKLLDLLLVFWSGPIWSGPRHINRCCT